jgi:osmotically-inducible protein OsmY
LTFDPIGRNGLVEIAMHLLVLGLALSTASAGQSGLSQSTVPSPSQSPLAGPVAPASQDRSRVGAAESPDSRPEETAPGVAKQNEQASLESQIQNALGKDPTLIHDSVRVAVSEGAVELTGNVATSRERLTATRIAQSYAGSKPVVSRITVAAGPQESGPPPEKKNVSGSQRQPRP